MSNYITAVELGSSKVVVATGEKTDTGQVKVIAYCAVPCAKGIVHGEISNEQKVLDALRQAFSSVEGSVKEHIREVILCVSGSDVSTQLRMMNFSRKIASTPISREEAASFTKKAKTLAVQEGYAVYAAIPQNFDIDDHIGVEVEDIVGMKGTNLLANFRLIVGRKSSLEERIRVIENTGRKVIRTTSTHVALCSSALTETERENGAILVDIGAGITEVVVMKDNILKEAFVVPFAGQTVTDDIRKETNITSAMAEQIKLCHGCCIGEMTDETKSLVIRQGGGSPDSNIPLTLLTRIIEARMSEILEACAYLVEQQGYTIGNIPNGYVITGGTAYLTGIRELCKAFTGLPVRLASAQGSIDDKSVDEAYDTNATAVVGALIEGFANIEEIEEEIRKIRTAPGKGEELFDDGEIETSKEAENESESRKAKGGILSKLKRSRKVEKEDLPTDEDMPEFEDEKPSAKRAKEAKEKEPKVKTGDLFGGFGDMFNNNKA